MILEEWLGKRGACVYCLTIVCPGGLGPRAL